MAQALVPLKDLVKAKTRLAGVLSPSERRALVQAMAEDVLRTLVAHPALQCVTLLSDDPGAPLLASHVGAQHLPEADMPRGSLNALLSSAAASLLTQGQGPLLILHADLPLLSVADIDAVLAHLPAEDGLLIGPDLAGTGTNLLAFHGPNLPVFRFGSDSYQAHIAAGGEHGFRVETLKRQGLGLDVDSVTDLHDLLALLGDVEGVNQTRSLFQNEGLAARLPLALSSLTVAEKTNNRESQI
ncbi:MAG: 2-phospho-L-lactate guanylyltransferase [Pseudomonadota bacterium]